MMFEGPGVSTSALMRTDDSEHCNLDAVMKSSEETTPKDLNQPATSQTGTSITPLQTEVVQASSRGAVDGAFSRVPLDLLHEIVLYCLPMHPTIYSASPVISSLSRVSSAWRAAVLSSPRLWARLFLTVDDDDDLDHCARMVTRWFQRARSVPLSFFLNIDFEAFDEDTPRIHSFLTDLSSVMLSVQHFGLHARLTTALLCAFVGLEWELPQLKKLDLFSHSDLDQDNAVSFAVPLFQTAPNLVKTAIQNTFTSRREVRHILPWSQLTEINIVYGIRTSRWIEVLQMCPQMRVFDVFFAEKGEGSPSSLGSCCHGTHHSLERLYLNIDGGPPFLKLLSIYSFPSLQTLHVFYHSEPLLNFPAPQGISALANLREFSFSAMGLKMPPVHFTYMVEVLCEMVNLEELKLQQPTEDIISLYDAISFKRPEKAILPRLGTLKLWISSESVMEKDEELGPFFEMVSSRCEADTIPAGYEPLQELIVGVGTEDVLERMKTIFGPWLAGLPPQLRVSIDLSPYHGFDQPKGWTYPISE